MPAIFACSMSLLRRKAAASVSISKSREFLPAIRSVPPGERLRDAAMLPRRPGRVQFVADCKHPRAARPGGRVTLDLRAGGPIRFTAEGKSGRRETAGELRRERSAASH